MGDSSGRRGSQEKEAGRVTTDIPQLLSLVTVAKALCVSPHTVRSWVKNGRLRPLRICRRLLFDPIEVARFLNEANH